MNSDFSTHFIPHKIKSQPVLDLKAIEPELRYWLVEKKIGLPSLSLYLRTLAGLIFLVGGPLFLARLCGRLCLRSALHLVERGWARALSRYLDLQLDLEGLEHLDRDQSYVITPLHEGFADALALLHLPLKMRFVVRDELLDWCFLGPCLRDTGQLAINPEQGFRSYRYLRRAARKVLAHGESLVIFPQGTILGIETDFLPGAFALAHALNLPILPVALTGSHRVWEYPYTPRLRYGQRMSLHILPPLSVEEYSPHSLDELRVEVRRRLKVAAISGQMDPPRHFIPARDGYWDGYAYEIDPDFTELAVDVARHRANLPP